MNTQALLACLALLLGCGAYIFWPERHLTAITEKTRLDYLRERREVVFENLRDLSFEYKAGKFPEEDYALQRESLETEAAGILAEMDTLEAAA